ncbi:bacteriocin-like protein [Chryseobacterium endalhagicum]
MKNLKKLSNEALKTIKGSASVCSKGQYWCGPTNSCIPESRTCCL